MRTILLPRVGLPKGLSKSIHPATTPPPSPVPTAGLPEGPDDDRSYLRLLDDCIG